MSPLAKDKASPEPKKSRLIWAPLARLSEDPNQIGFCFNKLFEVGLLATIVSDLHPLIFAYWLHRKTLQGNS